MFRSLEDYFVNTNYKIYLYKLFIFVIFCSDVPEDTCKIKLFNKKDSVFYLLLMLCTFIP